MENWVNAPLIGKLELICMGGYNFRDMEWSLSFGGEFPSWEAQFEDF